MTNYKMIIQYEGTKYQGWQRQAGTANTIQGILEKALSEWFGEAIRIHGSGRTDSGVHAKGQTAHFISRKKYDCKAVMTSVNELLPEDIKLIQMKYARTKFHSRYHALEKTYVYTIDCREKPDVFYRSYAWHLPEQMDDEQIRKAAGYLTGTYDFKSFTSLKADKDTTRTIYTIELFRDKHIMKLVFRGNGFLQQMVRILTGTLVDVGRGEILPEQIPDILGKRNRKYAGAAAPPQGLCLQEVKYS